jgi:hypothetical protein
MSKSMRAKARVVGVTPHNDPVTHETLKFSGVAKSGSYPADGSDEDNTYAKFSPSFEISLTVANPALLGQFKPGDTFYIDFSPV